MIKNGFLGLAMFFVALSVNAQVIKAGLKGGLNTSNIISNIDNTQLKLGFQAGGMISLDFIPKVSIQTEILYSLQGTGFDTDSDDFSYRWDLHYLQVPVLAKIYLTDNLNIQVGPSFNFLLGASSAGNLDSGFDFLDDLIGDFTTGDIDDSFSNADIAAVLGIGYDINNVTVALRYNLSLTNINDIENDDEKWRNQVINLSLGYYFLNF
jgi:hypothetical protein